MPLYRTIDEAVTTVRVNGRDLGVSGQNSEGGGQWPRFGESPKIRVLARVQSS